MTEGFEERQRRLRTAFEGRTGYGPPDAMIVVLPSISFDHVELRKITGITFYEQRLLCLLLLLAEPRRHLVYVSAAPVDPAELDYYLGWLPDPSTARERLDLVVLDDLTPRALSAKLLESPSALARIRALVRDTGPAYLLPFNVTEAERRVADEVGLPILGPRPEDSVLGSKSGSRRAACAADVPVVDGRADLVSTEDVDRAITDLVSAGDPPDAVVVKLNNGFSGQGNAIIDCRGFLPPASRCPTTFCADGESWQTYGPKIDAEGAVVERLLTGGMIASPSVQVRIDPDAEFHVISTHDQVLGGQYNQVYLGCRFPAASDYRSEITELARRVSAHLARCGVIGTFGMDFFVQADAFASQVALAEINLRLGGTTHPNVMARLLTGATYDEECGELVDRDGRCVCYVASDNIKSPHLVGTRPTQVLEALRREGLLYDRATGSGAAPHLLGALPEHGKMGVTCLAPTVGQADDVFREVSEVLAKVSTAGGP